MKENYFEDKVSNTLLIPLACKAEESMRQHPIIVDDVACDILKKTRFDIKKYKNKKTSRVGTAIRAKYFDNETIEFINKNENPVIITLGCGLDARYQRIGDAAQQARFYYIDLMDVIDARKKLIPCHENEKYISGSILDNDWIYAVKKELHHDEHLFFIIEGVLMYFTEEQVKKIFNALCQNFSNSGMIFDMLNTWLSKNSAKHDTVKNSGVQFSFGLDDEKEIERWNSKLTHVKTKLFTEFSEYKRMGKIISFMMSHVNKYKTASKMVTYEIK
ncbi:class I SAM-dependent methyltransferase [Brenneria populi]|uniref:Class I SAM-dependent methyltransferase n=1 Tax=Brenneria populi TaxID=1505588 RepID=A0ABU6JR17_9GAMM|nr:class I SAM-dependent methyltransferase [Brenneria populi Li et al. 2015]